MINENAEIYKSLEDQMTLICVELEEDKCYELKSSFRNYIEQDNEEGEKLLSSHDYNSIAELFRNFANIYSFLKWSE